MQDLGFSGLVNVISSFSDISIVDYLEVVKLTVENKTITFSHLDFY